MSEQFFVRTTSFPLSAFAMTNVCSRKSLSVGDIDEIRDIRVVEESLARM